MSAKRRLETGGRREDAPERIDPNMFFGMTLNEEQENFANAIWSKDNDIIFCDSKAGTGKTVITTGVAVLLHYYQFYDNIIYIMSPYGERKQGWLPGTITEKSSVYFEAFYQALVTCNVDINTALNDESMVNQKYGTGYITCITDTFLRGSNLDNAVVILDESQNFTTPQLKKILTRINDNTKVVVIGHDLQCDLDDKSQSGFVTCLNHYRGMDRVAICELTHNYRGWISRHADLLPG